MFIFYRCNPKDNYFGIGYSGLDRRTILSGHVNLFDTPAFNMQDKNKKLSIHGQAFGVGAFEADDDDIYEREDMSRYDFSLAPERKSKTRWSDDNSKNLSSNCLEGFILAKDKLKLKTIFQPPVLPKDFVPVHIIRKSRFYPPIENVHRAIENGKRKDLTAADRAKILEDTCSVKKPSEIYPNSVPSVASNIISKTLNLHGKQQIEERQKEKNQGCKLAISWMEKLNVQSFVKGGIIGPGKDLEKNLKELKEFKDSSTSEQTNTNTNELDKNNSIKNMKSFFSDPDKQRRFEQYLVFIRQGEKNKLESIQSLSMTEWDREHERVEFEQAIKLVDQPTYDHVENKCDSRNIDVSTTFNQEDEMKQAVKMKMFGKLTRERIEWKPASIVCKRFNIPEPKIGCAPEIQKKSRKFSIFDSFDWNNSTKFLRASKESNEINISPKDKNIINNTNLNVKTNDNKSFDNDQTFEPISEKMRNFEVSYEKVFGKEMPETSSKMLENEQNVDDKSDAKRVTEITDQQDKDQKEINSAINITLKSTSKEKKDLFKAIFLSSSEESDSELEESVDSEAVKSVLIGKVPSEINLNRNTSPPRGIFAKVDLDSLVTNSRSSIQSNEGINKEENINTTNSELEIKSKQDDNKLNSETQLLSDMYGPALPSRLLKNKNEVPEASSSQFSKPIFKSVVIPKPKMDSKISGVWIEREKMKKTKKEKKKHKHKEHKSSKHKRKSKKEKRDS